MSDFADLRSKTDFPFSTPSAPSLLQLDAEKLTVRFQETRIIYTTWFASVWCFFAALMSGIVLLHFSSRRPPRINGSVGAPVTVKTVEQGAATTVWAAFVAPADEVGRRYCEDCHVADVVETGYGGVKPYAIDPERAKALWAKSEEMVGERFFDSTAQRAV